MLHRQLWSQLGLKASLTIPTVDSSTSLTSFDLGLVHAEDENVATRGSLGQIIANTRPPKGVPIGNLEEVKIIWIFSQLTRRTRKTAKKRRNVAMQTAAKDEGLLPSSADAKHDWSSSSQPNPLLPQLLHLSKDPRVSPRLEHTWSTSQPVLASDCGEMLDAGGMELDENVRDTSSMSVENCHCRR